MRPSKSSANIATKTIGLTAKRQRLLARLMMLAQHGRSQPSGLLPTSEELAMLFDEQLDYQRKQQVISHINHNEQLMQQWTELVSILTIDNTADHAINNSLAADKKTNNRFSQFLNKLVSWQRITGGLVTASLVAFFSICNPRKK